MTDTVEGDVRVSPEGRIVIPAAVRAALGLQAGDRMRLTLHDGEVHLVPVRSLLHAVWANNRGGDAGDSVKDIRAARGQDTALVEAKRERVDAARDADERSEEAITADLLASLGLSS